MKFSCSLTALINVRACSVSNSTRLRYCSSKTQPLSGAQIQSTALKDLWIHASFTPLGALMAFSAEAPRSHCACKTRKRRAALKHTAMSGFCRKRCSWLQILVPTSGFLNEKRHGLQQAAHPWSWSCLLYVHLYDRIICAFMRKYFHLLYSFIWINNIAEWKCEWKWKKNMMHDVVLDPWKAL